MTFEMIGGLLRHLLTFGGGFLVSSGYLGDDDVTNGVAAFVTLVGIIWSAWQKKQAAS